MCFSTEKGLTFSRFALHLAEFGFIKTKECLLVFINVNPLTWCYILNSEEILLHTELCPSQTNILGCGHVCCIIGSRATLYFLVFLLPWICQLWGIGKYSPPTLGYVACLAKVIDVFSQRK